MSDLARGLARVIFGNEGLSRRLEKSAWVQAAAHKLRAREWLNTALTRFPLRRCLPGSGVRFNIETFETLAVERAYLGNPVYTEIFGLHPPATFIDLGCNSGIFPCLIAHVAIGSPPRGLCIDANATQVRLAQRTIALNGWNDIHVRWGLVGNCSTQAGEAEFFLHPTSLGSSQFAYQESESGRPPKWTRTVVPSLQAATTWNQLFGLELRCACLKIDIEGSEMHFLRQESAFLTRVDTILLEWHSWTTTREQVVRFLDEHSFELIRTIEETPRHGVLYFRQRRSESSGD